MGWLTTEFTYWGNKSISGFNLAQIFALDRRFPNTPEESGLNMSIIKKRWKIWQELDFQNSPKPIEVLIEKCEFVTDWFQTILIKYFSLMQSHQKIPFWELSFNELSLNLNILIHLNILCLKFWFNRRSRKAIRSDILFFSPVSIKSLAAVSWGIYKIILPFLIYLN